MTKLFFEENQDNLNQIRSTLLEYHLEFEQLKLQADTDFKNGLISKDEYDEVRTYRLDEYHTTKTGRKSPYSLTKNQVALLREYGNFNEQGSLMLDSIREEYKAKQETLTNIFESIRTLTYFNSLSEEELIATISAVVESHYNDEISKLSAALTSGATSLTIDGENIDSTYLPTRIRNLELHKIEALGRIRTSSYENLIAFIVKFYKIDYAYYEWFKVKSLQKAATNQELYDEHEKHLITIKNDQELLQNERENHQSLIASLTEAENSYSAFRAIGEGIELPNPSLRRRIATKIGIKPKSNLDELRTIFEQYTNLPELNQYITSLDSYSITDPFTIYMSSKYNMMDYVPAKEFKSSLIANIDAFYQKRLTSLRDTLATSDKLIDSYISSISSDILAAEAESRYIAEISRSIHVEPTLQGLSSEEQERIFRDMNIYFQTRYQTDVLSIAEKRNNDDVSKSKRGNK